MPDGLAGAAHAEGGAAVVEVVQQQMALVVGAESVHGGEHEAEPVAGVGEAVESAVQHVVGQWSRQHDGGGQGDGAGRVAEDESFPFEGTEQGAQGGGPGLGGFSLDRFEGLLDVGTGDGPQIGDAVLVAPAENLIRPGGRRCGGVPGTAGT
ncbi:hypothetical protein ABZT02_43860 [Streptomyces sp. NPDC005402]|uniref:hypothetical protein n=1 Tax=Streptomyces sp. NPDC005402 TaxID=3155338 RepID=UPI0033BB8035